MTLPKSGKDQSDHSMRYRVHSKYHKSLRTHEFQSVEAKTEKTLSELLVSMLGVSGFVTVSATLHYRGPLIKDFALSIGQG